MFLCILKTERCRKVIKLILCSSKKAELRSIRESYSKADFSSLLKQINYCCCLQNRTDSEGMISISVKIIRHYMNGCWQRDICADRNFEKMTPPKPSSSKIYEISTLVASTSHIRYLELKEITLKINLVHVHNPIITTFHFSSSAFPPFSGFVKT